MPSRQVFGLRELRQHVLSFVYPECGRVGNVIQLVKTPTYRRHPLNTDLVIIRIYQQCGFGHVICCVKPEYLNRDERCVFHLYPRIGDRIRIVRQRYVFPGAGCRVSPS